MTNRKNHNSILFVTTLGVYLGLLFFSGQRAQAQDQLELSRDPLRDLGLSIKKQVADKSLDLDAPFELEFKATLMRDGNIAASKITRETGNTSSLAAAKNAIEVVHQSGAFQYITNFSPDEFTIILKQDDSDFSTSVALENRSEPRARAVASALTLYLSLPKSIKKDSLTKHEELLLDNSKVTSLGKTVTIALSLPKAIFREMVEAELARVQ